MNLDYGAYGVDIFFVVSGFIMYYTTFGTDAKPGSFLIKRLIRIFPLYFILSTVMFVLTTLSPASFNRESPDVLPIWNRYFSFRIGIHVSTIFSRSSVRAGRSTTRCSSMWCLPLPSSLGRSLKGLAVLPMIFALIALGYLHPMRAPAFLTYTSPLMLEFCFGISIAACLLLKPQNSQATSLGLIGMLATVIAYFYIEQLQLSRIDALRPIFVGLPATLLVTVVLLVERHGWLPYFPFLVLMGDASYSLYLVHGFALDSGDAFGYDTSRSIQLPHIFSSLHLF